MKKRRKIITVVVLILLLLNLSIGVFAEGDPGTTRPKSKIYPNHGEQPEYTIVILSGEDEGTSRPK